MYQSTETMECIYVISWLPVSQYWCHHRISIRNVSTRFFWQCHYYLKQMQFVVISITFHVNKQPMSSYMYIHTYMHTYIHIHVKLSQVLLAFLVQYKSSKYCTIFHLLQFYTLHFTNHLTTCTILLILQLTFPLHATSVCYVLGF